MYKLLILGIGGFIGAIGCYTVSGWIQRLFKSPWYPIGTLGVKLSRLPVDRTVERSG